jgi:hypothetical protein
MNRAILTAPMSCRAGIKRLIGSGTSAENLRIKVEIGFVVVAADGSTLLQIHATAGFPRKAGDRWHAPTQGDEN